MTHGREDSLSKQLRVENLRHDAIHWLPRLLVEQLGVAPSRLLHLTCSPPPAASPPPPWRRVGSIERLAAALRQRDRPAAGSPTSGAAAADDVLRSRPPRIALICGEPAYPEADAAPSQPWLSALRFWADAHALAEALAAGRPPSDPPGGTRRSLTAEKDRSVARMTEGALAGCAVVPARCVVRVAGAALPDVAASRSPLERVLGLDLSGANSLLGAAGAPPVGWVSAASQEEPPALLLPQAASYWQLGRAALLTQPHDLLELDFRQPLSQSLAGACFCPPVAAGRLDAALVWADYDLLLPSAAPFGAQWPAALSGPLLAGVDPEDNMERFWRRQAPAVLPPDSWMQVEPAGDVGLHARALFDPNSGDISVFARSRARTC